ncbi:MAG: hypothetical protein ACK6D1_02330, partial [Planctomycetota bacterium]
MPRTPLAGFLARFVADAHAADQDGPRPTPTDTGRRRFLAGASAAVRAQQFCQQVEPVFNGTLANWNGLAAHATWHDQPLQRCSNAYWRVGQCQLFAGVEGERRRAAPQRLVDELARRQHAGAGWRRVGRGDEPR